MNDCLIKGKAVFLTQLKRLILTLKITKKTRKVVSVMKEVRQASKLILGGKSEPRRGVLVLWYFSAIKISISKFDSQTKSKISFSQLSDISKACESTPPNEARQIIDTMRVVRTTKVKKTYKELFKTVTKFILPSSSLKPL